jgi:hypothetical protein
MNAELILNDRMIVDPNLVDMMESRSTPHHRDRDTIGLKAN